jgi:hypothetical protein
MAPKPAPAKLPTPPKPPTIPSGIRPSNLPGASKATQQYTTPAGPRVPAATRPTTTVPSAIRPQVGITPPGRPGTQVTAPVVNRQNVPTPTANLTTDQQRIADLERQLREREASATEDPGIQYQRDVETANRKSAFQILADEFTQRGLPTLAAEVERFMKEGLTPAEARISIRNTEAYKDRFKGNEGRIKKGLGVYQPDEYLAAEETYRNLLLANNLQDLVSKNTTDAFISGAVSAQEVQDRIQNVFNKIDNADPTLKSQVSQYFSNFGIADPNLQRTQLASALLTGETSSMALERQLKKAQLRAGAALADVTIAESGVESLQKQLEAQNVSDVYGVAKTGFSTLAQTQRETERLSGIYGAEQAPMADELQQEAFFGLQSQRRKKLQEREQATFGGQAGISTAGLARGTAGSF